MDGQTDIHLFQSLCTKRSRISKFLLSWFMIWLDVGLGWVVAVEIFQFDVMHAMPVRICCRPQLRLPGCLSEIAVKLIINSEGYCRETECGGMNECMYGQTYGHCIDMMSWGNPVWNDIKVTADITAYRRGGVLVYRCGGGWCSHYYLRWPFFHGL